MTIKLKSEAKVTTVKASPDFERFQNLGRLLVNVPKEDIKKAEKKAKEKKN